MDSYSKEFISDYKKATDKEFEIFLAKSNVNSCIKDGFPEDALVEVKEDIISMEKSFMAERQKLASYQLSPQQAISILKQSEKTDNNTLDLNAIDGADCYRFMNKAIQANPEVAHTAWKQDNRLEKHFPTALKERMEGHQAKQVFESMDKGLSMDRSVEALNTVRDLTERLTSKNSRVKTAGMSMA